MVRGDKLNPQNFTRGSDLRKCLQAPKNHRLVVVDSSQIEARVVAWLAEEILLLLAFADPKRDVYCEFAEVVYGHPVNKVDHPDKRFIAKTATLGLGFQMGAPKYQATLAAGTMGPPVQVTLEEATRVVQLYRSRNANIKQLWARFQSMLPIMLQESANESFRDGTLHFRHEHIALPNGLFLHYPDLRATYDHYREEFTGFTYRNKLGLRSNLYGGLLVENCIASGTPVLTDTGWIPIEQVQRCHKIWDGLEWVTHGGLLYKGIQTTGEYHGVRMTPDHEILTTEGWKHASQSAQYNRAESRLPDGYKVSRLGWQKILMELPMRLWSVSNISRHGISQGQNQVLRMQNTGNAESSTVNTRDEQTPGLCSVPFDDRPLPSPHASSMEQLRRAGHQSKQSLANLRSLLERYGAKLQDWVNTGSYKQRRQLHTTELSLGHIQTASPQPPRQLGYKHPQDISANRDQQINPVLQDKPRMANTKANDTPKPQEQRVYDLVNCGPRQRFVVQDKDGQPLIVHNCVQALARIVVAEQMLAVRKKYKLVMFTHDEFVACVHKDIAKECLAEMLKAMRIPPTWAPDLPLDAEGGYARAYSK